MSNDHLVREIPQLQKNHEAKAVGGLWLLVFDLDGTLIDSSEDLCAAVNAALVSVGRASLPPARIAAFIGDGAATLVRRAIAATAVSETSNRAEALFDDCFAFFLQFYRTHKLDTTTAYPGVKESLSAMRSSRPDLLMAVLTNKPVNPSREICAALGLAPFFFANYGGNSFATKKPEPEGLLKIMQEAKAILASHGADPDSLLPSGVVMIGDSEVDVLVGRACGARTVGCGYGLAPESLVRTVPDHMVATASAWPKVLGFS